MVVNLHVILCCIFFSNASEAARILGVFPVPSISHQVVFRTLTQELVKRGHEVTVITTDPAFPKGQAPPNLREIDLHEGSYKMWNDLLAETSIGSENDLFTQLDVMLKLTAELVRHGLENPEVQKIIKEETFDLLLLEGCVRSALVYSHIFKSPVILVSSLGAIIGNYEAVGAPIHPMLYPNILRQRLVNLTVWEKITELYNEYRLRKIYKATDEYADKMIWEVYGPDMPSVTKLAENIHMLFLNEHPVFHGARPVPPTVIYMGGVHQIENKELPAEMKSYLDSSKNGVIYISFGTNVNTTKLPVEKIEVFVRVLSQLPYDVLWKWNSDRLPGRAGDNIRTSRWLPQSDLLRHPKIKLFITQGGLQSTDEAIVAGVPLIGVPMLADQWYNVEKYIQHRIGVRLDITTVTENQLRNAIETVINDKSYRQNIERLHRLIADQPQPPLERAVWWIEHMLRHGGARHLRAPAANMSWAQYLELELVLVMFSVLTAAMTIASILMYCIFRKLRQLSLYYSGKLKKC